jgi:membrane protein DedA with SNARE-associated domain
MSMHQPFTSNRSPLKNQNKKVTSIEEKSAQAVPESGSPVRSFHAPEENGKEREPGQIVGEPNAPESKVREKKKATLLTNFLRVLALFAVIGITLYIISIRTHVGEFAAYGYPGIFLVALLANATVLLPAPGVAVIYAMGAVFNPIGVALAAGTGAAIGELSGYLAGFSGQAVIDRGDVFERIHPWVEKYGGWAILVLSAIPNPFFDIAGIAAGMTKMPVRTFLFFTWIGQMIKMLMFALAGKYSINWISTFFE